MVFTGLVQAIGVIEKNIAHDGFQKISVSIAEQPMFWGEVRIGDSVAIDGVCLTVDSFDEQCAVFRVSLETLSKTRIGQYAPQAAVNVECALRFGQPLGGHVVSGHVHTTTQVLEVVSYDVSRCERDIWFALPVQFRDAIRYKASVCINGTSLTVAEVQSDALRFRVSLIKQTVDRTTLKHLARGCTVNLELDQHVNPSPCDDEYFMRLALAEGQKGRITTAPNPWVGCVVVAADGVTVLGRGHHIAAGGEHAETRAINDALQSGHKLKNATLYVTLEPCHHVGRQPPCDKLIIEHGFKRVVFGIVDPDVRTNGSGSALLRQHGIQVMQGVCEEEIRANLRPYVHAKTTGLPFVIAKLALTVDGCFTTLPGGDFGWITNAHAQQHAHVHLRNMSQAIIVGSQTVLHDNPRLTTRVDSGSSAQTLRVIVDSHGSCRGRDDLHVFEDQANAPTLVVTTRAADPSALDEWTRKGLQFIVQDHDGNVNLREALTHLVTRYGVLQALVEGGAELQAALLDQRLVNEYWVYRSGSVLSRAGRPWASCLRDIGAGVSFKSLESPTLDSACDATLQRFEVVYDPDDAVQRTRKYDAFADALAHFQKGGMVIVMDDESRENEGDLIVRGDMVQPHQLAMMVRHTTGIVCVPMSQERADALELPLLVAPGASSDPHKTAFAIQCDAVSTSTGVSAADRCDTIRVLAAKQPNPRMLRQPGHMFPLIARKGGVLERRGHTEAAVDLCRLAGAEVHVGVISELNNDDGTMMRHEDCLAFSRRFQLPIIHIGQIADAIRQALNAGVLVAETIEVPPPVRRLAECELHLGATAGNAFRFATFESKQHPQLPHRVLIKDATAACTDTAVMVRVHSECFTGDVLGSSLCDCGEQLREAIVRIAAHPGVGIIALPPCQEGRGIGLTDKIRAYKLMQDAKGAVDTYAANRELGFAEDLRSYDEAIGIIESLLPDDRKHVVLLTSNPAKVDAFVRHGFQVDARPIVCQPSEHSRDYLLAKARKHKTETVIAEPRPGTDTKNISHPGTFYGAGDVTHGADLAHKQICVIQCGWHKSVSDVFLGMLREQLVSRGICRPWKHLVVPGGFEVPLALSREMKQGEIDCYIVVGALMKGETLHFEMMSTAIVNKLMDLQVEHDRPVVNCLLNVLNQKQMEDRFFGKTDMHVSIAATVSALLGSEKNAE